MSWASIFSPICDIPQYVIPTTGQTIVANAGTTTLLLDPAGALAALTVTLPSGPIDGQRFTVSSSSIITIFTMNGATIKGGLTSMILNGYAKYSYSVTASAWFRTG